MLLLLLFCCVHLSLMYFHVSVGIANALDLTDRILPRLNVRASCKPQLLHFTPYSKDQIVTVLESRLKQVIIIT